MGLQRERERQMSKDKGHNYSTSSHKTALLDNVNVESLMAELPDDMSDMFVHTELKGARLRATLCNHGVRTNSNTKVSDKKHLLIAG
jgi:hypothetical protein